MPWSRHTRQLVLTSCLPQRLSKPSRPFVPLFRAYDLMEALQQKDKAVVNLQFVVDTAERVTVNKERTVLHIRDPSNPDRDNPVKVHQLKASQIVQPNTAYQKCLKFSSPETYCSHQPWTLCRTILLLMPAVQTNLFQNKFETRASSLACDMEAPSTLTQLTNFFPMQLNMWLGRNYQVDKTAAGLEGSAITPHTHIFTAEMVKVRA